MNRNKQQARHNLPVFLYYSFKTMPFLVGGLSIYLGYRLFVLGVTGQASLSVDAKTIKGQLLNAAPGLFFAVGGITTVIIASLKGMRMVLQSGDSPSSFCIQDEEVSANSHKSLRQPKKHPDTTPRLSSISYFNQPPPDTPK